MAIIGDNIGAANGDIVAGQVKVATNTNHIHAPTVNEEIFKFGFWFGDTSSLGKSVTLSVVDITSGVESAPTVATYTFDGSASTFYWDTYTLPAPVSLTVGKTYSIATFSADTIRTGGGEYYNDSNKKIGSQSEITDPLPSSGFSGGFYFRGGYAETQESTSAIEITCDSGSLLLQGTAATFGAAKNSETGNKWFNGETWKNPTWGTLWWAAIDTTAGNLSLQCDSGSLLLQGTDASFDASQFGTLNLSCDSGSLLFQGADVTFDYQATVTTAEVQAVLDASLQENTIDIIQKRQNDIYHYWYCVGNVAPYAGKAMWVRTVAGNTPADQANDIEAVMLQDGNADPDAS